MINASELEKYLNASVIGQQEVVKHIAWAVARAQNGFSVPNLPMGTFLFLGPTGVGKTKLCLKLVDYLYKTDDVDSRFFRLDMAEYQHADTVQRLVGETSNDNGILGNAIEKINANGGGIILFDEIEKANPLLSTLFLAILDAARFTSANGKTHDLAKFFIVATSNLGSSEIVNMNHSVYETIERNVRMIAQQFFRPEVLARWQEAVVFNRLDYEAQMDICRQMLDAEIKHCSQQMRRRIEVDTDVFPLLIRKGFNKQLGARPLRTRISKDVEEALVRWENLQGITQRPTSPQQATPIILRVDEAHDCLYASILTY